MKPTSDVRDDSIVAGGGLLNRRKLLASGLALGGVSVAAGSGIAEEVGATAPQPDWVSAAGLPVRTYGMPSPREGDVKRALFQIYKDLAPEFSFSATPLQRLRGTITPNGLHYEVHHGGRPDDLDPAQHALMIHGLVDRPLKFDLAALERYPMISKVHFIECAGNGFLNALNDEPPDLGLDMLQGLVSNTEWTGIPLSILMDEAGVKPEGQWAIAIGNDAPNLTRSIPMEKLMRDGMLALYQNGERVRPEQGYPMRLLLPGYEGNMQVKWLTSLWVTDGPAYTRDESGAYSDPLPDGKANIFSVSMGVKSLITHPSGQMSMSGPGLYQISGLAWTGAGKVEMVEISADGGATWAEADLHGPVHSRAFTRFSLPWMWDGSPTQIRSRATDEAGDVQPVRSHWKTRYHASNINHYNAVQAWDVAAAGTVSNAYS